MMYQVALKGGVILFLLRLVAVLLGLFWAQLANLLAKSGINAKPAWAWRMIGIGLLTGLVGYGLMFLAGKLK